MTIHLDRALADLKRKFPSGILHIGITNCRRKNNTKHGPWSEHSWGNAADIHVKLGGIATGEAKKLGDKIAAYMRSRPDLWSEVYWQVAAHYDHIHGTANPRRNYNNAQVPPCANGGDDMPLSDDDLNKIRDIVKRETKLAVWSSKYRDEASGGQNIYAITILRRIRESTAAVEKMVKELKNKAL